MKIETLATPNVVVRTRQIVGKCPDCQAVFNYILTDMTNLYQLKVEHCSEDKTEINSEHVFTVIKLS